MRSARAPQPQRCIRGTIHADTPYNTNLPPDLRALKEEIEGYARGYGLDFYETIFEVIDADDLNEIAAYGGFPTRYPHWSFGMSYEELQARATTTGCRRSTRWSSTTTRATPT